MRGNDPGPRVPQSLSFVPLSVFSNFAHSLARCLRSLLSPRVVGAACLLAGAADLSAQVERAARLDPDFAAAAREAAIRLPPPPVWSEADGAAVWTADDLRAAFARVTDTPPTINHIRDRFLLPQADWIRRYKTWFARLERPLRLRFEAERWDCDDYANCFVTFADLLALRAREARGPLAVGWATVFNRHPFAGIEAGGAHAVVVVATAEGVFVIEPQDGTMIALEKYPNRDTFEMVYF